MIKTISRILILLFFFQAINAQDEGYHDGIELLARPLQESIMLRWAPASPVAWQVGINHGYMVERYTIIRDTLLVEEPDKVVLTPVPLKPLPVDQWEPMADTSDLAAIAAQAMYGESFEVTATDQSDFFSFIQRARDQELRFSFALHASGLSKDIAVASGLFFEDHTARENEKYLYMVYTPSGGSIPVDSGFIFSSLADYNPLPRPIMVAAAGGDHSAFITWDKVHFERIFNAYIIERSSGSPDKFIPISSEPFVNVDDGGQKARDFNYLLDSLPDNQTEYFYRVRGISPFGEISGPSDTLSVKGLSKLSYVPNITGHDLLPGDRVQLTWESEPLQNDLLEGFNVYRSKHPETGYEKINEALLKADKTSFTDSLPAFTNYYKVEALGKDDDKTISFPYLVQLEDSIPPDVPVGLEGKVDKEGRVELQWIPNTEPDLQGYRVFRANFIDAEYLQVTSAPLFEASFVDTFNIHTLNRHVYYKIAAVDNRHNVSELTEALQLDIPDLIPPSSPVFKTIRNEDNGIYLEWYGSSSDDVAKHLLYRKEKDSREWMLTGIFENFGMEIYNYLDSLTYPGHDFEYTCIAVDSSDNESEPAQPVTGRVLSNNTFNPVTRFYGKADYQANVIRLSWTVNIGNVERFLIYRQVDGETPGLYASVAGNVKIYEDILVKLDTTYMYYLQVEMNNGSAIGFSVPLFIKY